MCPASSTQCSSNDIVFPSRLQAVIGGHLAEQCERSRRLGLEIPGHGFGAQHALVADGLERGEKIVVAVLGTLTGEPPAVRVGDVCMAKHRLRAEDVVH